MHQLRVALPRSPSLDSHEVVLVSFSRESSKFLPPYDHADPVLVFDVRVSAAVVDIYRMLARIDQQTHRLEIDIVRLVSSPLETSRPLLGASQRQSIRRRPIGQSVYSREWGCRRVDRPFEFGRPTLRGSRAV